MGLYDYERFIADFAKRTKRNLEIIRLRYEDDEKNRYDVTQLINSLFGLLIVPNEKYKFKPNRQGVSENTLKKTAAYKQIDITIGQLKQDKRFFSSYEDEDKYAVSSTIRHMRNALAHSGNKGLHFLPCHEGDSITGVIFYDSDYEYGGNHEFCVELTIDEIRDLAEDITEMYSEIEYNEVQGKMNKELYELEVQACRKLFERGER